MIEVTCRRRYKMAMFAVLLFSLLFRWGSVGAEPGRDQAQSKSGARRATGVRDTDLDRSRNDLIQRLRETRAGAARLLELRRAERERLRIDYERHSEYYRRELISRSDLAKLEHELANVMLRVIEDERWLAETDLAISEVSLREELLRLPDLGIGGYAETPKLLRYNGGTPWTPRQVARLEQFFVEKFGRALPISALGQTKMHDHLRFDHRDAIDIALHPDSVEGQSLLSFLRQAGIPFLAFRGVVPGSSTGAHIHIGKPSRRF